MACQRLCDDLVTGARLNDIGDIGVEIAAMDINRAHPQTPDRRLAKAAS